MMERVAEAHIKARAPKSISHNAALFAKADLESGEQAHRMFDFLARHHLRAS
jgi:hypothetical protein